LNIFGKDVDTATLEKISQLINSSQGQNLKKQLQNIDKETLINMFTKMNITQKDVTEASEKIKKLSQDELIREILKKAGRNK